MEIHHGSLYPWLNWSTWVLYWPWWRRGWPERHGSRWQWSWWGRQGHRSGQGRERHQTTSAWSIPCLHEVHVCEDNYYSYMYYCMFGTYNVATHSFDIAYSINYIYYIYIVVSTSWVHVLCHTLCTCSVLLCIYWMYQYLLNRYAFCVFQGHSSCDSLGTPTS